MSKITTKANDSSDFGRALFKAMEEFMADESKKIVERHTKEIAEELERKRSEMVAKAVIHVSRYSQMEFLRDVVTFRVERTDIK